MTAITPFTFTDQHTVRTVLIDGDPWFVAADVAAILGYRMASDMTRRLDEDEKGTHSARTPGGQQSVTVINESGLYSAILGSQVAGAKDFKRWVTHEVLPQIRRTGQFGNALPATFADALEALAAQVRETEAKDAALALAAPKVEAFDDFMESDGTYRMDAAAKSLLDVTGLGRNNLMRWLREQHVLMADNTPYQRYAHWFKVTASSYRDSSGAEHATRTTYVRPAGLDGIRQMWRKTA